ncbi:MAG: 23S rRNA (uracil(1939)-C(5))-methyltransferase RlmD [Clostridia bacterium]|nr:23S rRNA (uracil(1939)-C(5))-methyltransferase RlmD [Clostridia bacterium]
MGLKERNMPVEKNKEYIVDIIDNGFKGEGIAKIDDFTIFINGAIKGERVKILIVKVHTSYAFGKIIEFMKKASFRVEEDCATYKRCGGCSLRHVDYKETLKIKQNAVQSLIDKTLKDKIKVEETLGMERPFYYRNKLQYPIGLNKTGDPIMGVYANRTHEIIPVEKCLIQNNEAEEIAKDIFDFIKENKITIYNESNGKGLIRHIIVKIGVKTNEVMCVVVINGSNFPKQNEFIKKTTEKHKNIKSIVANINTKNTNVILGNENINLYGNGYIQDVLGKYTFNISPMSFYQVNPVQAERLYNIAIEGANINKDNIVFDLYCGIGTISLFVSEFAKKVYGVEIVEEAVKMAKENAKINNVYNTEFLAGDVELILDDLVNKKKINPDVVIVDPPRRGLDNESINNLLRVKTKRIVYISCNPATLIRDLAKLENYYKVNFIKPVDMFPYTSHVECVALLCLR